MRFSNISLLCSYHTTNRDWESVCWPCRERTHVQYICAVSIWVFSFSWPQVGQNPCRCFIYGSLPCTYSTSRLSLSKQLTSSAVDMDHLRQSDEPLPKGTLCTHRQANCHERNEKRNKPKRTRMHTVGQWFLATGSWPCTGLCCGCNRAAEMLCDKRRQLLRKGQLVQLLSLRIDDFRTGPL